MSDQFPSASIVAAVDGSAHAERALRWAAEQALLEGRRLVALTAGEGAESVVRDCFWDAVVIERAIRYDRNWTLDDADAEDLRAVLKHSLVDEALASSEEPWDLIVVGRHPMTTVTRVFTGSIASAVLERAHSPVAVVPERAATA